jgi:hypothetical protein
VIFAAFFNFGSDRTLGNLINFGKPVVRHIGPNLLTKISFSITGNAVKKLLEENMK